MLCEYKYKSGIRKGADCGKEECKTKLHLKITIEETNDNYEEVSKERDILQYAFLVKNELDYIINNKIPTNIIFKDKTIKRCIINETVNTNYETQCYIMYKYKSLTGNTVDEFERIISPVNMYQELDKILKKLTTFEFLSIFADIKSGL
jgi:hypothetical protein